MATVIFHRKIDPTESAFTVLVPQDWQTRGGIQRANLMTQVVSAQSIEAKVDFAVMKDAQGSVMIRFGPEIKYCDMRMSLAGMMFPKGSNYQGMIVWPLLPASQFLTQMMFPWAHPQGQQAQQLDQQPMPALAEKYSAQLAPLGIAGASHDASMVTYTYVENGVQYKERASTAIENLGPMAAGMWSNKETLYLRAPVDQFDQWLPVLLTIQNSVKINPQWLAREMQSQGMLNQTFLKAQQAQQARDRQVIETQHYLQNVDREIADGHQRTNAEINHDNYLNLIQQEEYKNPFTGDIENGSNQWNYRWMNSNGDEVYSNNENDDPNREPLINQTEWKRTPIQRRPI